MVRYPFLGEGYPRKTGQLEDSHRDLKCRKARPRWLRIQKPEALMLQSVPPYVDTLFSQRPSQRAQESNRVYQHSRYSIRV